MHFSARTVVHRVVVAFGLTSVLVLGLVACSGTDVVGKVATTSFEKVVDASKASVFKDEATRTWNLGSPAGDLLRFSADFSKDDDVEFLFDAAPFLAAGLDPSKLPSSGDVVYSITPDAHLRIAFDLGPQPLSADSSASLASLFKDIVRTRRDRIGYHEKLDHYGIKLGNGNMFEWARDMAKNDKDIVWVLNPDPFIQAGVDPAKVQGWAFAKVELKDDAGKAILVDKLLRPYNIQ